MTNPNLRTKQNRIFMLVHNALFIVVALILGFVGRNISIFPVLPFLKVDLSDIPVFISTLIFGTGSGLTVLFVVNLLRTLFFSNIGLVGFTLRIVSAIMVIFLGYFCKENAKLSRKILGLFLGVITYTIFITILNYFFYLNFLAYSQKMIAIVLLPITVPFNIVKLLVITLVAMTLVKPIQKLWHRNIT